MAQLSSKNPLAAGVGGLPTLASAFAATQAAWRFYANDAVTLAQLAGPLVAQVDQAARQSCQDYILLPCDWSFLSYPHHRAKADRTQYNTAVGRAPQANGYELFSVLALSDTSGQPLGPVALQLRHRHGVAGTFGAPRQESCFRLDRLAPALRHVAGLPLGGKIPVFMIDREADSVAHLRQWTRDGQRFVVRANPTRCVRHAGVEKSMAQVVKDLHRAQGFCEVGPVEVHGQWGMQSVAQTQVTLHRAACQYRVSVQDGVRKRRHRYVPGPALPLRLVVSEVRNAKGKLLACWLLLTNLEERLPAPVVARWYYWRWRIETYHKLLKTAGVQVEAWGQRCAAKVLKRLLVCAMAVTLMWRLARDQSPQGEELRDLLVRLSGRQMTRGTKTKPGKKFTEPALLAGLGILLPMLALLEQTPLETLRQSLAQTLGLVPHPDNSA